MATFPSITPDYVFNYSNTYGNLVSTMWGKERRRNKWGPKRSFHLRFDHITTSDMRSIYEFFVARRGDYAKFDWVNPLDDVTYSVRFAKPDLKRDEVGVNAFNCEIDLVEVL